MAYCITSLARELVWVMDVVNVNICLKPPDSNLYVPDAFFAEQSTSFVYCGHKCYGLFDNGELLRKTLNLSKEFIITKTF